MELLSSSPTQSEEESADPDLVEVLLRNKTKRARAPRTNCTGFQNERACAHSTRTGAAKPANVTSQRSLCERCRTPSRLWLHHTCRVPRTAGGTHKNASSTAGNAVVRSGGHAARKELLANRLTSFCTLAAHSSSCSGTPVQHGQICRSCGSTQQRGDKFVEDCSCRAEGRPAVSVEGGHFTQSTHSAKQGRAWRHNGVQRPLSTASFTSRAVDAAAPYISSAKQLTARSCSVAIRRADVKRRPASGNCFAKNDADRDHTLAVRRATPLRQGCYTAVHSVRRGNMALDPPLDCSTCHCQKHSRHVTQVGASTPNLMLERHNPAYRSNVVVTTRRGATARECSCISWGEARGRGLREPSTPKRRAFDWNIWEAEDEASVTNPSREGHGFVDVPATAEENQEEVMLSKESLCAASSLEGATLNEDRQTQCSEESFASPDYSPGVSSSQSDIQEDGPGREASSSTAVAASSRSKNGIGSGSTGASGCGDGVNASGESLAATCLCGEVEEAPVAASSGKDAPTLLESCPYLRGGQRRCVRGSEAPGDAYPRDPGERRQTGVAVFPASESSLDVCKKPCSCAEQQEPGSASQRKDDCNKEQLVVSYNFEGGGTMSSSICDRVGRFLDSVECFLQESDPQLRRKKLCVIHATFVGDTAWCVPLRDASSDCKVREKCDFTVYQQKPS